MYEFGNCYFYRPEDKNEHPQQNYAEALHLGIFMSGKLEQENWTSKSEKSSFYFLKSRVNAVLDKLGISPDSYTLREVVSDSFEQALEYISKTGSIVTFGKVHKSLLKKFDIEQEVYAAEFDFDCVLKLHKNTSIRFKPLPKFPEVRRDLSLMLDKDVRFETLHSLAFQAENKLLRQVDLFDIYEGENIERGKKSYALSFVLLDENKTLTDNQIDKVMKKIALVFEKDTGAIIRGA